MNAFHIALFEAFLFYCHSICSIFMLYFSMVCTEGSTKMRSMLSALMGVGFGCFAYLIYLKSEKTIHIPNQAFILFNPFQNPIIVSSLVYFATAAYFVLSTVAKWERKAVI